MEYYQKSEEEYKQILKIPSSVMTLLQPVQSDIDQSLKIKKFLFNKFDTPETLQKKASILDQLQHIIIEWSKEVASERKKIHIDEVERFQAKLLPFGSYSLGVSSKDGDLDLVCVAPSFFDRDTDFFTTLYNKLVSTVGVINCSQRKVAKVPIITFSFQNQSIDISLANLDSETLPKDIEHNIPDQLTISLDETSRISLGGRRDNMKILQAVIKVNQLENFRDAAKAIKIWTKSKGLTENKLGYFGGIVYSIMLAKICQMFPNYKVNQLIEEFFRVFSSWDWEVPVMIEPMIEDKEYPLYNKQWVIDRSPNERLQMVILTPAYPSQQSMKCTNSTFRCIKEMIQQSHEFIQSEIKTGKAEWEDLFQTYKFFDNYKKFIQLNIVGKECDLYEEWKTGVQVKMLQLFINLDLFFEKHQLIVHPFPITFHKLPQFRKTSNEDNLLSEAYFIGLKRSGNQVNDDKKRKFPKIRGVKQIISRFVLELRKFHKEKMEKFMEKQCTLQIFQATHKDIEDIDLLKYKSQTINLHRNSLQSEPGVEPNIVKKVRTESNAEMTQYKMEDINKPQDPSQDDYENAAQFI